MIASSQKVVFLPLHRSKTRLQTSCFERFGGSLEDQHPDAHAVRCKLALQVAFVEDVQMPFEIHVEVDPELWKVWVWSWTNWDLVFWGEMEFEDINTHV